MKNQIKPSQQNTKSVSSAIPKNGSLLRTRNWILALFICIVLLVSLIAFFVRHEPASDLRKNPGPLPKASTKMPGDLSLADLMELPGTQLAQTDIAVLNLLCSERLPGAGQINVSNLLTTLDQWAKRVQSETDRHLYRFRANPQDYSSSEAYFRMLMMAVVFYEDLNTHPGERTPNADGSPYDGPPKDGLPFCP